MTEILINAYFVDFVDIILSPVDQEVRLELEEMDEHKEYDDVDALIESSGFTDFFNMIPNKNRDEINQYLSTTVLLDKSRYLKYIKDCPRNQGWRLDPRKTYYSRKKGT